MGVLEFFFTGTRARKTIIFRFSLKNPHGQPGKGLACRPQRGAGPTASPAGHSGEVSSASPASRIPAPDGPRRAEQVRPRAGGRRGARTPARGEHTGWAERQPPRPASGRRGAGSHSLGSPPALYKMPLTRALQFLRLRTKGLLASGAVLTENYRGLVDREGLVGWLASWHLGRFSQTQWLPCIPTNWLRWVPSPLGGMENI